ncbi:hypothetical protein NDU88_002775 [Pleurodeles waltl]|uniref:Uncharacterized protein n=1 Tax=Pleurodeles waltl TaxID=8319 RepID=A0AAV7LDD9_PLEWA|nr:hypothetical protein NDU88_002775 [Pleurodeles waltl]
MVGPCDGSTGTEVSQPYPWGASAASFSDPDAVLSWAYTTQHPGNEVLRKGFPDVPGSGTAGEAEERAVTAEERQTTTIPVVTMAEGVEMVVSSWKKTAEKRTATAEDGKTTEAQEGEAAREGVLGDRGQDAQVQPGLADARGQEAGNLGSGHALGRAWPRQV